MKPFTTSFSCEFFVINLIIKLIKFGVKNESHLFVSIICCELSRS